MLRTRGQTEMNVLRISRIISVLNSTASSDPLTDGVVTDEDIPLSAQVLRSTTGEAEHYKHFLQKQSRMQESWGEQRRKRIATTNPAPVQPTEKETPLLQAVPTSPMKTSTMPKEVPVAMVPASPRRVNTVERELQEAENVKEELKKEKASVQKMREEYAQRLADLRHREEQANSTANIEKVTCLLLYFKFIGGKHQTFSIYPSCFLFAGHTKFSPDWCFGLAKQAVRKTFISDLFELAHTIDNSTVTGVNVSQLCGLHYLHLVHVTDDVWKCL